MISYPSDEEDIAEVDNYGEEREYKPAEFSAPVATIRPSLDTVAFPCEKVMLWPVKSNLETLIRLK